MTANPFHFVFLTLAGWVNREPQKIIDDLKTENEVVREHIGKKRILFTDKQRRRQSTRIVSQAALNIGNGFKLTANLSHCPPAKIFESLDIENSPAPVRILGVGAFP